MAAVASVMAGPLGVARSGFRLGQCGLVLPGQVGRGCGGSGERSGGGGERSDAVSASMKLRCRASVRAGGASSVVRCV